MGKQVSELYLKGIKDGRMMYKEHGIAIANQELDTINSIIEKVAAGSGAGQYLRGERDFWKNQISKA